MSSSSVNNILLYLAWLVAVIATLGSLYFSEIKGFIPCGMCWYQRIAMYPLAVFLGIAAFYNDYRVRKYVLPITMIGSLISLYHYSMQKCPLCLQHSPVRVEFLVICSILIGLTLSRYLFLPLQLLY